MYHYNHNHESVLASSKLVNLKLIFSNDVVTSPVFTKQKIIGGSSGNASIQVILTDANTRQKVTTGPVAFARVKIVIIRANYDGTTTEDDEFEKAIVVNWGKKKNLLCGDIYVDLKHGSGTVGDIRIKHDSHPISNVVFRLGAMVVDCPYEVKQAITQPFIVKDRRNVPKSLRSLSLTDKVWQLKNIGKKGVICKRLEMSNVYTVMNFLNMYYSNHQALQEIYGSRGKKWEMTVNHAKSFLVDDVGNSLVGSTSQQSNIMPSFDDDGNVELDKDCYFPQFCENDSLAENMIVDHAFSTEDLEKCDMWFQGSPPCQTSREDEICGASTTIRRDRERMRVKAKKRWVKMRTLFVSIASFMCVRNPIG